MKTPIVTAALLFGALGCATSLPELAERERPATLAARAAVDVVGKQAREPMIVRARDGALFVTGYGESAPVLWRSSDGGKSWAGVDVGTQADGAIGNSDVDLAVAPDGTLYFIAMSYDRTKYEGLGIAVASSRDNGLSWTWTSLSRDRFDDRPWVKVAPDGTAHVIGNDGAGQSHAVSTDRGLTWMEKERIRSRGGSSHLAISPAGAIAARITPLSASANRFDTGVDSVAISTDGGKEWMVRGVPGNREWSPFDENKPILRWVEPVAWDSTGALYSLWSEGSSMWLARSADNAKSWEKWRIAQDTIPLYFPYLVARGNGELAATWYSGLGASIKVNVAHLVIPRGSGHTPRMTRVPAFAIPSFARSGSSPTSIRDTSGEYVPIMFLGADRLAVVTTIQDHSQGRYGFTFREFTVGR